MGTAHAQLLSRRSQPAVVLWCCTIRAPLHIATRAEVTTFLLFSTALAPSGLTLSLSKQRLAAVPEWSPPDRRELRFHFLRRDKM